MSTKKIARNAPKSKQPTKIPAPSPSANGSAVLAKQLRALLFWEEGNEAPCTSLFGVREQLHDTIGDHAVNICTVWARLRDAIRAGASKEGLLVLLDEQMSGLAEDVSVLHEKDSCLMDTARCISNLVPNTSGGAS